jgi:PBP1b-binding outer membrane lipoprotein LpoB
MIKEDTPVTKSQILIFIILLVVIGCSNENAPTAKEKPSNEHIFKNQVQAIEKAKKVEIML